MMRAVIFLLCVTLVAGREAQGTLQAAETSMGGPVPADGKCINESEVMMGNHCVKLSGPELATFMHKTEQNFMVGNSPATTWCICLHLYVSTHMKGGDTTQCSPAALASTQ